MRKFFNLTVLTAFLILPSFVFGGNASGKWEARTMGSKIKADINQQGDKIDGVANVYPPAGKKTTYHFSGTVQGDRITASHPSGHTFKGRLTPSGKIAGELKTKNGYKVSITASRRR